MPAPGSRASTQLNSSAFLLERVPEVAVARALHDRLRALQLHARAVAFDHRKVRAARQQESQLGNAELLVELRVTASGDIDLVRIRRLLDHVVVERVSG